MKDVMCGIHNICNATEEGRIYERCIVWYTQCM